MIATPTLKDVFAQYEKEHDILECIVLAHKFNEKAYSEFIQRIGYINIRSGEAINFYCAGYGAYIPDSEIFDLEKLPFGREYDESFIPWTFSQTSFGNFINDLENSSKWRYSGGTEIILLGRESIFKDCIIFRVEEMISDKVVKNPSEITEMLFRVSKDVSRKSELTENVEKIAKDAITDSFLSFLPKPFEIISKSWDKGKHYAITDLK